jgi:O-antigen/teichoic acid export membrane protein
MRKQLINIIILRILNLIIYYLSGIALAKLLVPENFDIVAFIINVILFLSVLVRSGMDPSIPWIFNKFNFRNHLKKCKKIILTCNIFNFIFLIILSFFLLKKKNFDEVNNLLFFIGISLNVYFYSFLLLAGELFKARGTYDIFLLRFQTLFSGSGLFLSSLYFFYLSKFNFTYFVIIFYLIIFLLSSLLIFKYLIFENNFSEKINIPHNQTSSTKYLISQVNNTLFTFIPVMIIFFLDKKNGNAGYLFLVLKFGELISYPIHIIAPTFYKYFFHEIKKKNIQNLLRKYFSSLKLNASMSLIIFFLMAIFVYFFSEIFFKNDFFILNLKFILILFTSHFLTSCFGPIGQLFLISANTKYLSNVSIFVNVISILLGIFLYIIVKLSILNSIIIIVSMGIILYRLILLIIFFRLKEKNKFFKQ